MYEIVERLLKENHITAKKLSTDTGIATSTLSEWKHGRSTPKYDKRKKIADYFGVTVEYLDGNSPFPHGKEMNFELYDEAETIYIPILGCIPVGMPIEAVTDRLGEIELKKPVGDKTYWALKVKGDSMTPKILDGDVIIFQQQPDCENGDICVVRVNGTDATLKKVIKRDNSVILQPLNPEYEPLVFSDNSADEPQIEVLGVVKELRRML